jgi:tetratricopeptide (TPR) repeat protein
MKKIKLASQFPNISRTITEWGVFKKLPKLTISPLNKAKLKKIWFFSKIFILLVVLIALVFGIAVFSYRTYQYYSNAQKIIVQREQIQSKINFWQSIADKYDGFRDAYFQMAILDYSLGNFPKAKSENKKALSLDPNFVDAQKLEVILGNN